MLHIVFMVLKILGIILAILLGILLVSVGILLFVPVRYKVEAEANDGIASLHICGSFSWFLHLISGYFNYIDGKFCSDIRILGIKVKSKKKKKKKKKKKNKKIGKKPEKKKRNFVEKIKYTIKDIYDKIKLLIKRKKQLDEFLADKSHKRAWKRIKIELKKLWNVIKPQKLLVDVRFGTDNPSLTGKILAGLSMLYPFYPRTTKIIPNFNQKILQGKIFSKGHFYMICIVGIIWRSLFDKDIRKTFNDIEKIKKENRRERDVNK